MSGEGQVFPNTPYLRTCKRPAEVPDQSLSCQSRRPSQVELLSGIEEEENQRGFWCKTEIYFHQVTSYQPNRPTQCWGEKLPRMLLIVGTRARGKTRQHGKFDNFRQTAKPQKGKETALLPNSTLLFFKMSLIRHECLETTLQTPHNLCYHVQPNVYIVTKIFSIKIQKTKLRWIVPAKCMNYKNALDIYIF